jgi:hypothetical protein
LAAGLTDTELLRRVAQLAGREREATVELVGHLAELDTRGLHRAEGYGSLFAYCTGALRLAEHAAYNRIEAARLARRFPALLDLLADGSLNLSTARLLAPHLRPDNFETLVAQARGRSKREVEVLVAGLAPRPDVAASVRRLPTPTPMPTPMPPPTPMPMPMPPPAGRVVVGLVAAAKTGPDRTTEDGATDVSGTDVRGPDEAAVQAPSFVVTVPARSSARPAVAPLSPERYRVQFTIDAATREKLGRAQDLLRREIPNGDPAAIFARALDLLLEDVARKKLGAVRPPSPRPRSEARPDAGGHRRHVPASVKRAVWVRDGGRCAFVTVKGRRCAERTFLEFHHREPYAVGGEPTVSNISLRCRAHNQYEAELDFGRRLNSPRGEFSLPVQRTESLAGNHGQRTTWATAGGSP